MSQPTAPSGVEARVTRSDRGREEIDGTDSMQTMKHKRALQHAQRAPGAHVPQPRRAGSISVLGSARAFAARECRLAVDAVRAAFRRTLTM